MLPLALESAGITCIDQTTQNRYRSFIKGEVETAKYAWPLISRFNLVSGNESPKCSETTHSSRCISLSVVLLYLEHLRSTRIHSFYALSSKNVGFSKTSGNILPTRTKKSLRAGQQLKSNIVASFERFSIFTHKKHPNILKANLNLNINMHLKKTHQLHYLHKLPRNAQDAWTTNPCPRPPNGSKNSSGGHLVPLLTLGIFSMDFRRRGGDRYSSLVVMVPDALY